MGINGLWDVIGDGQVISIAKYASDHFEKHGRPLRIAIDEAGWRFNNLNDHQVKQIRGSESRTTTSNVFCSRFPRGASCESNREADFLPHSASVAFQRQASLCVRWSEASS